MAEILEARTDDDQLKQEVLASPVPADLELEAVNRCLAAAAYSLKFDIAELWRFAPVQSKKTTGSAAASTAASTGGVGGELKPFCEHVYTMPATLKTYTGRIVGMWNSGFDDSRAPQHHVVSPAVRCAIYVKRTLRSLFGPDYFAQLQRSAPSIYAENAYQSSVLAYSAPPRRGGIC